MQQQATEGATELVAGGHISVSHPSPRILRLRPGEPTCGTWHFPDQSALNPTHQATAFVSVPKITSSRKLAQSKPLSSEKGRDRDQQ